MECTIPLTQNQFAIVDAEDYESLAKHKWKALRKSLPRKGFYAVRQIYVDKKYRTISMHREVLGLRPGDSHIVDHKNNETLDNRRENLRIATANQNQHNRRRPRSNTSGFKGVSWHKATRKWRATINVNGEAHYLGYFSSPQEAHVAYSLAAQKFHGEFAKIW